MNEKPIVMAFLSVSLIIGFAGCSAPESEEGLTRAEQRELDDAAERLEEAAIETGQTEPTTDSQ